MRITDRQITSFKEMVNNFALRHHLDVRQDTDVKDRNVYRVRFDDCYKWKEYAIVWNEVESLTDAATRVFVDASLEFHLNDKYVAKYVANDVEVTQALYDVMHPFEPVRVIFSNPATIVFWRDGSKTVVKCQSGEKFDEMTGLAMAISKKALGNKGNYNEVFKKFVSNYTTMEGK